MNKALALTTFSLAAGMSSLMATYQFGDYVYYNFEEQVVQNRTLEVVQDSNLSLNFLTNPYYSPNGYVITDWAKLTVQITDGTTGDKTFRDVEITGTTVNIGDFLAGDSLFFYVSGSQGTTYTTEEKHIGYQTWDQSTETPESLFFDGNYGEWNSQYAQLTFRIDGSALSPSGQPLPGVAVSMFLGSAGIYVMKRRKNSVTA